MGKTSDVRLEVLICTIGIEGIERIAGNMPPEVEGVEWMISWQMPGRSRDFGELVFNLPDEFKNRRDIRIFIHDSKGVAKNRNYAIEKSRGEFLLMSDDDLTYTEDELRDVINTFERNPQADILLMKYSSSCVRKIYPTERCEVKKMPKGYYTSIIEIGMRRERIGENVRFDERFGLGTTFLGGEEDAFLHNARKKKMRIWFEPVVTCSHNEPSTGSSRGTSPEFIEGKGAVFCKMHPVTWILYMVSHAMRQNFMSKKEYITYWLNGVRKLRTTKKV